MDQINTLLRQTFESWTVGFEESGWRLRWLCSAPRSHPSEGLPWWCKPWSPESFDTVQKLSRSECSWSSLSWDQWRILSRLHFTQAPKHMHSKAYLTSDQMWIHPMSMARCLVWPSAGLLLLLIGHLDSPAWRFRIIHLQLLHFWILIHPLK